MFFRLEQPIHPSLLIFVKFQQEFSLMAAVSNVPYITWKMMSISSCHLLLASHLRGPYRHKGLFLLELPFWCQKVDPKTLFGPTLAAFNLHINRLAWSDKKSPPNLPGFRVARPVSFVNVLVSGSSPRFLSIESQC